jgi:hypothetical protein
MTITTRDKENLIDSLYEAQALLNQAIDILEAYVRQTNDAYAEAYLVDQLKLHAGRDHGFLSDALTIDDLIPHPRRRQQRLQLLLLKTPLHQVGRLKLAQQNQRVPIPARLVRHDICLLALQRRPPHLPVRIPLPLPHHKPMRHRPLLIWLMRSLHQHDLAIVDVEHPAALVPAHDLIAIQVVDDPRQIPQLRQPLLQVCQFFIADCSWVFVVLFHNLDDRIRALWYA